MKRLIYASSDTYESIQNNYPQAARFIDDLYGQVCSVYDQGNGRFALLNDQDHEVVEVRIYKKYAEDPEWLHRYCRNIRDYRLHRRLATIEYTPDYK